VTAIFELRVEFRLVQLSLSFALPSTRSTAKYILLEMADTTQTHRAHRVSRVKLKEQKKNKHEKGFNPRVSVESLAREKSLTDF
jgi:hypothetical protein